MDVWAPEPQRRRPNWHAIVTYAGLAGFWGVIAWVVW